MLPIFRDAPAVKNVIAGQNATCDYDVGWTYYALRFVATVTTSASSATEPLLSDAIGQIVLNVNGDPKRTVQAYELNAIQSAWSSKVAAKLYSKTANDLITATTDGSANSQVQRTSTWVLDVWLAEPTRDSYAARKAFAWPTAWNNKAVGAYPANYTANLQAVIGVPSTSTQSGVTLAGPVIRSEMMVDSKLGALVAAAGQSGPGQIGTDILALAGIPTPDAGVGAPIMPVTHFYRFAFTYGGTSVQLRGTDWPFTTGSLQQLTAFCQAGDDITNYQVLLDTAIRRKVSKASNDLMNIAWGWNDAYGAGTSGTNYLAADVCHIAFDFTDDPADALSTATYKTLELDLTLNQAVATNKSIIFVPQFYRNALLL